MTFEDLFLADLVIPKLCLIVIGKVFIYMCVAKKFVDEIRDRQYDIRLRRFIAQGDAARTRKPVIKITLSVKKLSFLLGV